MHMRNLDSSSVSLKEGELCSSVQTLAPHPSQRSTSHHTESPHKAPTRHASCDQPGAKSCGKVQSLTSLAPWCLVTSAGPALAKGIVGAAPVQPRFTLSPSAFNTSPLLGKLACPLLHYCLEHSICLVGGGSFLPSLLCFSPFKLS